MIQDSTRHRLLCFCLEYVVTVITVCRTFAVAISLYRRLDNEKNKPDFVKDILSLPLAIPPSLVQITMVIYYKKCFIEGNI